jgi:hypothetical protein
VAKPWKKNQEYKNNNKKNWQNIMKINFFIRIWTWDPVKIPFYKKSYRIPLGVLCIIFLDCKKNSRHKLNYLIHNFYRGLELHLWIMKNHKFFQKITKFSKIKDLYWIIHNFSENLSFFYGSWAVMANPNRLEGHIFEKSSF